MPPRTTFCWSAGSERIAHVVPSELLDPSLREHAQPRFSHVVESPTLGARGSPSLVLVLPLQPTGTSTVSSLRGTCPVFPLFVRLPRLVMAPC